MFGLTIQLEDHTQRVKDAADQSSFRNLGHAAASIRKTAIAEIITAEGPSEPGMPPHSRRGQLRRAIKYDVDKASETAVIGPEASIVGEAGAAHEFGGEFRGEDYPERPFMDPALEANVDRFASEWAGSIGE